MPITVSVPGKLMIMGEHAVVYGRPCLVTAVDERMKVTAELLDDSIFNLDAKDLNISNYQKSLQDLGRGEIPKEARFAEISVSNFQNKYKFKKGVKITTQANFSANFGFGSSSATVVGIISALAELFHIKLSRKELFDLAYKIVLDIQGKGSGFDVAAAIYGGTILFQNAGKIIESLIVSDLCLVVGYSGVKADTVEMMNLVFEKMKNYQSGVGKIFDNIGILVDEAKKSILEKNWVRLGTLMDYNQNYLEDLGVSTDKLNQMIKAAKNAGAYGAKLSGAGGGDCMIALVSQESKFEVRKAIEKAGGQIIDVTPNAMGVNIEKV